VPTVSLQEPEAETQKKGIWIYDALTEEDLCQIAKVLKKKGHLKILAGCAGFASILPDLLELETSDLDEEPLEDKLLMICGSVNPTTKEQMAYGESLGYRHVHLKPVEKLERSFWDKEEGIKRIQELHQEQVTHDCLIIDANDPEGCTETVSWCQESGLTTEQVRQRIADTIGVMAMRLAEEDMRAVWLLCGGDTLLAFLKELNQTSVSPMKELAPGCVLSKVYALGQTYHIISKSGGFGEKDLLEYLMKHLHA